MIIVYIVLGINLVLSTFLIIAYIRSNIKKVIVGYKVGLFYSRHNIQNEGLDFCLLESEKVDDVTADYLNNFKVIERKMYEGVEDAFIKGVEYNVNLYISGLTYAVIAALNVFRIIERNKGCKINIVVMHYEKESEKYVGQEVK